MQTTKPFSGGAKENRTPALLLARQALYQLSYGPIYGDSMESWTPVSSVTGLYSNRWTTEPFWRRPQDSNLQALSGQLLSRQLPHHPDRRHILMARETRLELITRESKSLVIPFHHSRMYMVGREGIEPTRAIKTRDLQSRPAPYGITYPYQQ